MSRSPATFSHISGILITFAAPCYLEVAHIFAVIDADKLGIRMGRSGAWSGHRYNAPRRWRRILQRYADVYG